MCPRINNIRRRHHIRAIEYMQKYVTLWSFILFYHRFYIVSSCANVNMGFFFQFKMMSLLNINCHDRVTVSRCIYFQNRK